MERIAFTIPGEPVAKGRPRVTTVNGRPRTYTPAKTVNYEGLVAIAAAAAGCQMFDGPVRLSIVAYWCCPKSKERKRDPRRAEYKISKPDADNICKAISDGLNGIAYRDDSQVVHVECLKMVAAQGEPARCEVLIERLV